MTTCSRTTSASTSRPSPPARPKLAGAKRAPPVRWKSPAILQVARLVKRDGAQLRQLLRMDAPREEVPTVRAQLAEARAQTEQAEAETVKAKAALLRRPCSGSEGDSCVQVADRFLDDQFVISNVILSAYLGFEVVINSAAGLDTPKRRCDTR